LNAWFGEEGATIRPTGSEREHEQAWQLGFKLKAYGYGEQLQDVPPIVSRQVNGNRIEYQRGDRAGAIAPLASRISHPALTEWYENKAAGIEQGFTINERPAGTASYLGNAFPRFSYAPLARSRILSESPFRASEDTPTERGGYSANWYETGSNSFDANEPLRVLLAVTGELHAQVTDGGQNIELVDRNGKGALSYSKLVAQDADGKKLAARMEASADGREIALVVDEAGARYPIVGILRKQKLGSALRWRLTGKGQQSAHGGRISILSLMRALFTSFLDQAPLGVQAAASTAVRRMMDVAGA
jgi:hypothetical protein